MTAPARDPAELPHNPEDQGLQMALTSDLIDSLDEAARGWVAQAADPRYPTASGLLEAAEAVVKAYRADQPTDWQGLARDILDKSPEGTERLKQRMSEFVPAPEPDTRE